MRQWQHQTGSRIVTINPEIRDFLDALELVDHHVHSTLIPRLTRAEFELNMTEASAPIPSWMTQFDSQVGFAIRRYCAPRLGLDPHADADTYWAARSAVSAEEATRALVGSSGIATSLIDTGYVPTGTTGPLLFDLDEFAALSGQQVFEIVRLETLLEQLASAGVPAAELEREFDAALQTATQTAVGFKSIIAYRFGFDFDPREPTSADFLAAAEAWLSAPQTHRRVSDPVLLRALLWKGARTGLPVQIHAGYGDPSLDLDRCNPLLLTPWLRLLPADASDVVLLHCYPYHREAGYLAQVFPRVYFDVGLAINYAGAQSEQIIAESLELAPFAKILFSTDAWGLPELHHIGAALWRRGMARILSKWVADDEWSLADAVRVADMIGRGNARRLYKLADH